jgi:hypothetical protein
MKAGRSKILDIIAIVAIVFLVTRFVGSVYRNDPDYVILALAVSGLFFFISGRLGQKN